MGHDNLGWWKGTICLWGSTRWHFSETPFVRWAVIEIWGRGTMISKLFLSTELCKEDDKEWSFLNSSMGTWLWEDEDFLLWFCIRRMRMELWTWVFYPGSSLKVQLLEKHHQCPQRCFLLLLVTPPASAPWVPFLKCLWWARSSRPLSHGITMTLMWGSSLSLYFMGKETEAPRR